MSKLSGGGANWKPYVTVSLVALALVTTVAALTRLWVLTAIPIGFLFGFFLQKGDLCGASAFSEVLLMKEGRKIWGLWVCVVTAMAGFAILDLLGWVELSPKPTMLANHAFGGVLFGVGMVLAGGCVSGCLFKAGAGNLNSMAALLGIALGVSAVEHGPLHSFHGYLKTLDIKAPDGGSMTLSSLTGFPFWVLALLFVVGTVAAGCALKARKKSLSARPEDVFSLKKKITAQAWKPWQAGLAIGLLGCAAYLSSAASGRNYPLCVTDGVLNVNLLVTDRDLVYVYKNSAVPAKDDMRAFLGPKPLPNGAKTTSSEPSGKKVVLWLVALVVSLVIGSWVSGRLSGKARLLPKPPEQIVTAFFGGLLVGVGAAFAVGCVVGNIMSGWALMSVGSVLFGVVALLANWLTTYIYLMGGSFRGR